MEGLQKYFNKFLEKIDFDKTPYLDHIIAIEECLTRLGSIKFARRSGSTKRGTSVNSKSDIDLIVIFNRAKFINLELSNFFNIAYLEIRKCINDLNLNTKGDHGFKYKTRDYEIDLVIGFQDSNDKNLYRIPEKNNNNWNWIETKQITLEQRINKANKLTSGKAQGYVKLLKFWNYTNGKKFTSFYLETLIINKILSDSERYKTITYGEGIKDLFLHLIEAIYERARHPSGKGPRIAKLNERERIQLRNYLKKFHNKAKEGLNPKNLHYMNNWRNIFGDEFGK